MEIVKDNQVRDLSIDETYEVNGGNPCLWMALGYVGGKILDSAMGMSWDSGRTSSGGQMNGSLRSNMYQ
ncbi:hypothetical protein [Alteromonas hispanica]|uniref:Bacteriocin n=1 Tax=Alteromonas hispanica TaxID=315421 RepID=A0A6L9MU57_9ALTE|nr:hypothetical protein [Alteromonas hispanica]NDW21708.1 hypothetical protein [Alteromonas hispanica]